MLRFVAPVLNLGVGAALAIWLLASGRALPDPARPDGYKGPVVAAVLLLVGGGGLWAVLDDEREVEEARRGR